MSSENEMIKSGRLAEEHRLSLDGEPGSSRSRTSLSILSDRLTTTGQTMATPRLKAKIPLAFISLTSWLDNQIFLSFG